MRKKTRKAIGLDLCRAGWIDTERPFWNEVRRNILPIEQPPATGHDLTIRGMSKDELDALDFAAACSGLSREMFIRYHLRNIAAECLMVPPQAEYSGQTHYGALLCTMPDRGVVAYVASTGWARPVTWCAGNATKQEWQALGEAATLAAPPFLNWHAARIRLMEAGYQVYPGELSSDELENAPKLATKVVGK